MFSFSFVKEGLAKHRQWVTEVLYDCWDACTLPEEDLRREGDPRTAPVPVRYVDALYLDYSDNHSTVRTWAKARDSLLLHGSPHSVQTRL